VLFKVISYRHQAISAGFHLNTCTNVLYHHWLQAFARCHYLMAGFGKTYLTQQITIATLVVASFNLGYLKSGFRDISQGLRDISRNLGEQSRKLGEASHNFGDLSPNLWDLSRGFGDSPRDLGGASPRLRYRYLSLFYLYQRRLNK
jgi:hypothetical protein